MYDLSHQPLLDEQALPALSTLKDYLVHAHVGNCVKAAELAGYGDQHPRFGFPGGENGVPELVDFLQALFAVGYLKKDTGRDQTVGGHRGQAYARRDERGGVGGDEAGMDRGLGTRSRRPEHGKVGRRTYRQGVAAGVIKPATEPEIARSGDQHVTRPPAVTPFGEHTRHLTPDIPVGRFLLPKEY